MALYSKTIPIIAHPCYRLILVLSDLRLSCWCHNYHHKPGTPLSPPLTPNTTTISTPHIVLHFLSFFISFSYPAISPTRALLFCFLSSLAVCLCFSTVRWVMNKRIAGLFVLKSTDFSMVFVLVLFNDMHLISALLACLSPVFFIFMYQGE